MGYYNEVEDNEFAKAAGKSVWIGKNAHPGRAEFPIKEQPGQWASLWRAGTREMSCSDFMPFPNIS